MYLTRYDFSGDTRDLLTRHHAMVERLLGDVDLHVVLATEDGITVLDACPDQATMQRWVVSPEWTGALRDAGLPAPTVTPLGDVHLALARPGVTQTPVPA